MVSIEKNDRIFVDTSALVALFLKTESLHSQAKKTWSSFQKNRCRLFISDYILDETLTFLLARVSHAFSCEAGEAILNSQIFTLLPVQEEYLHAIFQRFKSYQDKEFSFTDVSSFFLMDQEKIQKAFTFDSDFSQAGFITLR